MGQEARDTSTGRAALALAGAPVRGFEWVRGARAVLPRLDARVATVGSTVASGLLCGLAQPPAELAHLSWFCLVPLFAAVDACRSAVGAALCGLVFGVVYSAVATCWLPGAVSAYFGVSPVLGWLAALGVYLVFAAVPLALFGPLARRLVRARGPAAALVGLPALWVASELARAHVAGGLPWTFLGHALYRSTTVIQIADVAGVYGVSWVIAVVNAAVFVTVRERRAARLPLGVALAVIGATCGYGHVQLAREARRPTRPAVTVGVLQPNQVPVYHATQVAGDRALLAHARLSAQFFTGRGADLVVWPENALPFYVETDVGARSRLRTLTERLGVPLIVGAPAAARETDRYFNAAHLIGPGGAAGVYRKRRLVPFAEYRPWRRPAGGATFAGGDEATTLEAAGTRWGPSICLDLIYAGLVRESVLAGAEALVNLSNDAWLAAGGPGGPAQQVAQTVFRAVETRRDVVRAASTGISVLVSAAGEPRALVPERRAGAFVAPVFPRRTLSVYTRYGDAFAAGCVVLAAGVLFGTRRCARVSS